MSFISDNEYNSRLESAYENEINYENDISNYYNSMTNPIINERFIDYTENINDFNDDTIQSESDRNVRKLYRKINKLARVEIRKANRTIIRQRKRSVKRFANEYMKEQILLELEDEQEIESKENILLIHQENLKKINNFDYTIQFKQKYNYEIQHLMIYLYTKYLNRKTENNELNRQLGYYEKNIYIEYIDNILEELRTNNNNQNNDDNDSNLYNTFKSLFKIYVDNDDDILPNIILNVTFDIQNMNVIDVNTSLSVYYEGKQYFKLNNYEEIENFINNMYDNKESYKDYPLLQYYESYKLSLINDAKIFIE
jgi:hypothetical protein